MPAVRTVNLRFQYHYCKMTVFRVCTKEREIYAVSNQVVYIMYGAINAHNVYMCKQIKSDNIFNRCILL